MLRLRDSAPGISSSGLAWRENPLRSSTAPSLVEVWLGSKYSYPRYDQHVPELRRIVLFSWEEEVLLVIAHEFRHIHQMHIPVKAVVDDHTAEVDAERFAIETLQEWRSIRRLKSSVCRRPDRYEVDKNCAM